MFTDSSKVNRGVRPSVQHLNYTAAWPITTDSIRCQQTGRKQSITVNRFYKFTVLSQLNREDSRTSHNVHAQRKEQRTSETYPFKGTQNQQSHGGLTLNAATHSPCRLHVKAAKKHGHYTSATQSMPRWQSPLPSILSTRPISSCPSRQPPLQIKSQISRLCGLLK